MFTCGPAFFTPIAGGGGGDPYFANVVLYLNGDSTTDLSPSPVALSAGPGASITFDTSNLVPGVVDSWIRTNAGASCAWSYASAARWAASTVYTIDYQIYFDSQPGNWVYFCADDFSRFLQSTAAAGGNASLINQGLYGAMAASDISVGAPHYIRLVSDGVKVARYVDGNQDIVNGFSGSASSSVGFVLLDGIASNPDYRFAQIRITKGVARNDPTDLTIPMQTAPWPTS